jgi:hypothetical protein
VQFLWRLVPLSAALVDQFRLPLVTVVRESWAVLSSAEVPPGLEFLTKRAEAVMLVLPAVQVRGTYLGQSTSPVQTEVLAALVVFS